MSQPLSSQKREAILSALQQGTLSQGDIARTLDVDQSTVSRIARSNGLVSPIHAMPKEAHEGKARWDTERRLGLLDETFDKARELLPCVQKPSELRDLQVAIGIGIDKARLESDLSTSNVAVAHHAEDKLTDAERQRIRAILEGTDSSQGCAEH